MLLENTNFEILNGSWVPFGTPLPTFASDANTAYTGTYGVRLGGYDSGYKIGGWTQACKYFVDNLTSFTFWTWNYTFNTYVTLTYTDDTTYTYNIPRNPPGWVQYTILGSSLASGKIIKEFKMGVSTTEGNISGFDDLVVTYTPPVYDNSVLGVYPTDIAEINSTTGIAAVNGV